VQGSKNEWIEIKLAKAATISQAQIYWFDDTGRGGVRVPASWKLLYKSGNEWKPVDAPSHYATERNAWNTTSFAPVSTSALRIEVTMQQGFSAGVQGEMKGSKGSRGSEFQRLGSRTVITVQNDALGTSELWNPWSCAAVSRHRRRHPKPDRNRRRDRRRTRRVVFNRSLNYDRDLPEWHHRRCDLRRRGRGAGAAGVWADALDRTLAELAQSAGLDLDDLRHLRLRAATRQRLLNQRAPAVLRSLDSTASLAPQLATIFSRPRSPVWLDASTGQQCREIEDALGGADRVATLTGSPACERFTGPQIRRFAIEQPDAYAETARVHLVSSYLASLLTGTDAPIDPGDGSGA
jgi:hypothetical protein